MIPTKNKVKAKIILWPKQNKHGEHPIKLRVTYSRKSMYYNTGYCCKQEHFKDGVILKAKDNRNIVISSMILKFEQIYSNIRINNEEFSFEKFEALMFSAKDNNKNSTNETLSIALKKYCLHLTETQKTSAYSNAKSLTTFIIKKNLDVPITEIYTKEWQQRLTERLTERLKSNTVMAYVASLQSLLRHLKMNPVDLKFKKNNEANPRALSLEQIRLIESCEIQDHQTDRARNIWMLSFYLRGMNLIDMASLKKSQTDHNRIEYNRSKTKKKYSVPSDDPRIAALLKKIGPGINDYLLPIFTSEPVDKFDRKSKIAAAGKEINNQMDKVFAQLGIKRTTFYAARHSFATALYHGNASIAAISSALGHANAQTTMIYLKGLSTESVDSEIKKII